MILDFDEIKDLLKINKQLIYQKFPQLAELISNGKFKRSWSVEINESECKELIESFWKCY